MMVIAKCEVWAVIAAWCRVMGWWGNCAVFTGTAETSILLRVSRITTLCFWTKLSYYFEHQLHILNLSSLTVPGTVMWRCWRLVIGDWCHVSVPLCCQHHAAPATKIHLDSIPPFVQSWQAQVQKSGRNIIQRLYHILVFVGLYVDVSFIIKRSLLSLL